jgi:RNA polymerase sigma-70 factor (ECF subfamily)
VDDSFKDHRGLLFSVAYRILGSAADAEDVVQDTWLKWSSADRSQVTDARAYLVRITGNLAVDRLRSAQVKRESYVGPWLPEPVLTSPDIAEDVERAESVSLAMLVVLETLSPLERAVFVLREVFGFPFAEIAEALDRSEDSVRQLCHRAREHVHARRPRMTTGPAERRAATELFFAAAAGGDINRLMEILAPDVTLWTDGGGKVRAALRPIKGAEKVAAWLAGVGKRPWNGVLAEDMTTVPVELNGAPGLVVYAGDVPAGTVTVDLDEAGRIVTVHVVANPDKLQAIGSGRKLVQ